MIFWLEYGAGDFSFAEKPPVFSFYKLSFTVFRRGTAEFFLEARAEIKLIFKARAAGDFHDGIGGFRKKEQRGAEFALVGVGDGRNARNALEFS